MYQFIFSIHVLIALFLVALVLVQQGKGATMGAAFGAGASQTVFGSRGSGSFLFRVTIGLACIFFATSIILNNMASHAFKQERGLEGAPVRQMHIPLPPSTTQMPTKSSEKVPASTDQTNSSMPSGIPTRQ